MAFSGTAILLITQGAFPGSGRSGIGVTTMLSISNSDSLTRRAALFACLFLWEQRDNQKLSTLD